MTITLKTGFAGIVAASVDAIPPNCQIAVGPSNVLTATTWRVDLRDKTGKLIQQLDGRTFFSATGNQDNPRVIYRDFPLQSAAGGSFLVLGILPPPENCIAMVSDGPEPNSLATGWTRIQTGVGTDFPIVGYNADGYFVTFGSPQGVALRIHNNLVFDSLPLPAELQAGSAPAVAKCPDAHLGDSLWLARIKDSDRNALRIWRVDNPFGVTVSLAPPGPTYTAYDIPITATNVANDARQPNGTSIKLTHAARANYRDLPIEDRNRPVEDVNPRGPFFQGPQNGDLWLRNVNGRQLLYWCAGSGGSANQCVVQWVVVDVTVGTAPALAYQGIIDGGANLDLFNATIAVGSDGTMAVNYLMSGPTQYILNSLAVFEPSGLMIVATPKASAVPLTGGRAGDYSGCCVDPVDGSFWSVNEVPDNSTASPNYNWSSWVQNFTAAQQVTFTGTLTMVINGIAQVADVQGTGSVR